MRRVIFVCLQLIFLITVAVAQVGVRGQIFLPTGSPLQKVTRFNLITDNGVRTEIYYTDSNGRIAMPQINTPYTIMVEGDGETYDTTTVSFNPIHAGNYIVVNLKPPKLAKTNPAGIVKVNELDSNVSSKAKEVYQEATKLLQSEKYDQAMEMLKRAISLQPNYVQAHNDLGAVYLKLNQLEQAADVLHKAIKLNERWYLPQLNLGITLNRQGKHKEAAELLLKLRKNEPGLAAIHSPLIESLIGSQAWQQAEEEIGKALTLAGSDAVDLKIKLGAVLMRQNKFADAVAVLREAVKAEPDSALANFNLGAALLQTGSLDEAETSLRRAYELKGAAMAGAQLQLGMVYHQKKNYAKAIEAFEAYLRDLPDAPNAAQVRAAIEKLKQSINKQ